LDWALEVYIATEALPDLINPFWMPPLLAVSAFKERHIVGLTFPYPGGYVPLELVQPVDICWYAGLRSPGNALNRAITDLKDRA